MRNHLLWGLCCLPLCTTPGLASAEQLARAQPQTVVRRGEDCQAIVRRIYGDVPGAMARFHAANPQLGGLPHVLGVGDVVNIPAIGRERRTARAPAPAKDPPRLSFVGPDVRTQAQNERGWSEALPEQPLSRRTRIMTGAGGGAEVDLQERARLQLQPNATVVIDSLPQRKSAGTVALLDGAMQAGVDRPKNGPLTVRTPSADIRLRGDARIEAESLPGGQQQSRVSVYNGQVAVHSRGRDVEVPAGRGTLVVRGQSATALRILPLAPRWEDGAAVLIPLLLPLDPKATRTPDCHPEHARGPACPTVEVKLAFRSQPGAEQYLVEVARDERFNDRRAGGEVLSGPFVAHLPPGSYLARVRAIDGERLLGPPSALRRIRVVAVYSDARPVAGAAGRLRGALRTTLRVPADKGLSLGLDGLALSPAKTGYVVELSPGRHRLALREDGSEPVAAELLVEVSPPMPPPLSTPDEGVAPPELPVPLLTPGFPARGLHPRTRAFAILSLGSSVPQRRLDTLRLDLGGEYAFLRRRLSVDGVVPLLYEQLGLPGSAPALGDIQLGFRAIAWAPLSGRLALGPLLRLSLPTGTYRREGEPGTHPFVLDPAVGLAAVLGPVGLLTTQGPTALLNVPESKLRWSMTYVAELRLPRVSLGVELGAALGLTRASSHGATLGGGVRVGLTRDGRYRLLSGVRGGLGDSGQALFGRYQVNVGAEWAR